MNQKFPSTEKLKSKKLLDELFTSGKKLNEYPIKLVYKKLDFEDDVIIKTGVSAPKRNFKKAVDRNRIKRLLREGYRLNKHIICNEFDEKYVCMFLYLGKEMPSFEEINRKMTKLLSKLVEKENIGK
jgi:ribonuclease P protein component